METKKIKPRNKKYFVFFLFAAVLIQVCGLVTNFQFDGILFWSLSIIFTLIAAYFSKDFIKDND